MAQITLRLYGTPGVTTPVSNLASVIVPRSARLVGILMNKMVTAAAGDDFDFMQVSLVSIEQFTVNDAQGVLADLVTYINYATGADWITTPSQMVGGMNVNVVAGQKIYLHCDAAVATAAYFANLYMEI
ncbi:MAG TPA: hypothetical protein EYO33_01060 [Phycisphaerales bacterium]|nr:hypothetical protein [Phycisphaerales bacterium]